LENLFNYGKTEATFQSTEHIIFLLQYGIVIWGTTFKTGLKRLSTLQNRDVEVEAEAGSG